MLASKMTDSGPQLTFPAPHVARIDLNRPHSANRIEVGDLEVLHGLLDRCESDPAVRVLILGASGSCFSSGFDLRALAEAPSCEGDDRQASDDFESLANRLESVSLVTIAAIQGAVLGGATDLALACDLRVGTVDAYMQMPAARFGLPLYLGALQRYASRLGINHAKRLVFMAQRVEAHEMQAIGFLTEIVPARNLAHRCLSVARRISEMPPEPLQAMKTALNAAVGGIESELMIRQALRQAFQGPDIAMRIRQVRGRSFGSGKARAGGVDVTCASGRHA